MQGFEDVTLTYSGVDYTIKAGKLLPVIADIEDILRGTGTQPAVQVLLRPGGPSYPRLAMAYASALNAGGCGVTGDEIYLAIMDDFAKGKSEAAEKVQMAIFALLQIISPPLALELSKHDGHSGDDEPGEAIAAE